MTNLREHKRRPRDKHHQENAMATTSTSTSSPTSHEYAYIDIIKYKATNYERG